MKTHSYRSSVINNNPSISALGARLKLCHRKQIECQSLQDYVKDLIALHDVAKIAHVQKRVRPDSESFKLLEENFIKDAGTSNPYRSDETFLACFEKNLMIHNNYVMIAVLALRGALSSKNTLLKSELQNEQNLGKN